MKYRVTLNLVLTISIIILIWLANIWFVAKIDLRSSAILVLDSGGLMGAAVLALFVFTCLVGLVGVVGWGGMMRVVRETINNEMSERIGSIEEEIRGRQATQSGLMIGDVSLERNSLEPRDPEGLELAIELCQNGYSLLRNKSDGLEMMALNNLVYFLAASGDRSREGFLLASASRLMNFGQAHSRNDFVLTACRVFLQFDAPNEDKRSAIRTLHALKQDNKLSLKQRREILLCLTIADDPRQPVAGNRIR